MRIKICYQNIIQVFAQVIHAFIKYLQSFMTYFQVLTAQILETGGVFLDIYKTFDRVWHNGLIFKIKQKGVSGNSF